MLREIIADADHDGKPVVRIRCPACNNRIDQPYSIKYGERVRCQDCREVALVTFRVERVPE